MPANIQSPTLQIIGDYHVKDKNGRPSWSVDWERGEPGKPGKFEMHEADLSGRTNERRFIQDFLLPALKAPLPGFVLEIPWGTDGPNRILFNKDQYPAIWYLPPGNRLSSKDIVFVCHLEWDECIHWDTFWFQKKAVQGMLEHYSEKHGDKHPTYSSVCTAMQTLIECLKLGL